ncbi:hypothetical protein SAY87_003819 [Trapa incisa]|uniref:Uncharacterized protein n=1 Tax=Trapa incisa TaxID=236973 RepID=A0AAN7QJR2_9MYRT|nr:hypothetical protein SAY87_003819 [Trapa incisa]
MPGGRLVRWNCHLSVERGHKRHFRGCAIDESTHARIFLILSSSRILQSDLVSIGHPRLHRFLFFNRAAIGSLGEVSERRSPFKSDLNPRGESERYIEIGAPRCVLRRSLSTYSLQSAIVGFVRFVDLPGVIFGGVVISMMIGE